MFNRVARFGFVNGEDEPDFSFRTVGLGTLSNCLWKTNAVYTILYLTTGGFFDLIDYIRVFVVKRVLGPKALQQFVIVFARCSDHSSTSKGSKLDCIHSDTGCASPDKERHIFLSLARQRKS